MQYTANYKFKKPDGNDTVDIDDLNFNADEIDKKIKSVEEKVGNINIPVVKVNGKVGDITLSASDIKTTSGATVEAQLNEKMNRNELPKTMIANGGNADTVGGIKPDVSATPNTLVKRDGNGYISAVYVNSTRGSENTAAAQYIYDTGDGWMRKKDLSNVRREIVTDGFGLGGFAREISNGNLNDIVGTGFYKGYNISGAPTNEWYHIIVVSHANEWVYQQAVRLHTNEMYYRRKQDNGWQAWVKLAHLDQIPTKTSQITNDSGFISSSTSTITIAAGADKGIRFPNDAFGGSGDSASITLQNPLGGEATEMTFTMTNDADDIIHFKTPSNNGVKVNGNIVWNSGNFNPDTKVDLTSSPIAGKFNKTATNPTTSDRLNYEGYFYATRVYNAVYNDYAEYFLKDDKALEYGDVISVNPDGNGYIKSNCKYDNLVVGVYSKEFAQCIGGEGKGDDDEKYASVGMAGRVNVKLVGKINKGDLICSSDIPGVAMAADEYIPGTIIGKALQDSDDENIKEIRMLIMNL